MQVLQRLRLGGAVLLGQVLETYADVGVGYGREVGRLGNVRQLRRRSAKGGWRRTKGGPEGAGGSPRAAGLRLGLALAHGGRAVNGRRAAAE